jgi:hypothetical protein
VTAPVGAFLCPDRPTPARGSSDPHVPAAFSRELSRQLGPMSGPWAPGASAHLCLDWLQKEPNPQPSAGRPGLFPPVLPTTGHLPIRPPPLSLVRRLGCWESRKAGCLDREELFLLRSRHNLYRQKTPSPFPPAQLRQHLTIQRYPTQRISPSNPPPRLALSVIYLSTDRPCRLR